MRRTCAVIPFGAIFSVSLVPTLRRGNAYPDAPASLQPHAALLHCSSHSSAGPGLRIPLRNTRSLDTGRRSVRKAFPRRSVGTRNAGAWERGTRRKQLLRNCAKFATELRRYSIWRNSSRSPSFPRSGVGTHTRTLRRPFNRTPLSCIVLPIPLRDPVSAYRCEIRAPSTRDAGASARRSHAGAWERGTPERGNERNLHRLKPSLISPKPLFISFTETPSAFQLAPTCTDIHCSIPCMTKITRVEGCSAAWKCVSRQFLRRSRT